MNVNGILGTIELDYQKVELLVGPISQSKPTQTIFPFTHSKMERVNGYLDYKQLKLQYPYINVLPDTLMRLDEGKMIFGQDAYSLMRPIEKKSGEPSQPWAVRTDLGWTTSGPLPKSFNKRLNCTTKLSCAEEPLTEQVEKWWDIEAYTSNCKTQGKSKSHY